jgi:peptide chain release factor subunit 1
MVTMRTRLWLCRYELKSPNSEEVTVVHLSPEQEKNKANFTDPATGQDLEVVSQEALLEWLANNYKNFGAILEIVTDKYGCTRRGGGALWVA